MKTKHIWHYSDGAFWQNLSRLARTLLPVATYINNAILFPLRSGRSSCLSVFQQCGCFIIRDTIQSPSATTRVALVFVLIISSVALLSSISHPNYLRRFGEVCYYRISQTVVCCKYSRPVAILSTVPNFNCPFPYHVPVMIHCLAVMLVWHICGQYRFVRDVKKSVTKNNNQRQQTSAAVQ